MDTSYDTKEEQTTIQLFGRLENGQSFAAVLDFKPYFFVKKGDITKLDTYISKYQVEPTRLKNFQGDTVTKISADTPALLAKLIETVHKLNLDTYEADIKPAMRFLMDQDILGSITIEGEYTIAPELKVDRMYKNPALKPTAYIPKLNIISLDTESSESGELFCIGLYEERYQKNFMVTNKKLQNTISCKTEEECMEKAKAELLKLDPDIITGWNMIDHDLQLLQALCKKHKLASDFGRNADSLQLRIENNFFKASSAQITGRQVLDGLSLLRDPFIKEAPSIKFANFDSYTLEDVSQAILGTGKLLKGKNRHAEITRLYKTDPQKIVDYNLMDCKLVYDILEKTKMLELALQRSQLTGAQLDKITASIAAFDSLYIREAHKKGLVCPTTYYGRKESKILGGFVKQAEAGIYDNVLVLDFKSLYPSVIKTFNIDPASYLGKKKEKNAIETPNGVFFKNQQGILPVIIDRLHEAREKAKKEGKELANYAIKIIMNSFYGCLASQNSRFFDFDLASSITHFAQFIIKLTAEEIEKLGYKVIYSDTDSVFVLTGLSKQKAEALGKQLEQHINTFYKNYIKKKYNRDSFLELQFEKLYLSLLFPKIRADKEESRKAAKKRYAGLLEKAGKEELQITGLEAIRGDWTEAAQEFQKELFMKAFHKEPIEKFIKEYIKKVKSGKLDDQLIYRKSIRKELHEYTKTTPPHVKAARLLDKLEGNVISYVITTAGPEPIQKRRHKLDYEHYIEKQIKPIAEQVLSLLNKDFDSASQNSQQAKLF